MSKLPTKGDQAIIENVVTENRTAAAFATDPSERYPAVLATPYLIADMERACAKILEPALAHGELSVGAHIDVRHMAPTKVGMAYHVTATYTEKAGALFWFDVVAEDDMGIIGKGRIARAIVVESAIMSR